MASHSRGEPARTASDHITMLEDAEQGLLDIEARLLTELDTVRAELDMVQTALNALTAPRQRRRHD